MASEKDERKRRLMIVSSSALIDSIKHLMLPLGYEVTASPDLKKAWQYFEEDPPELIVFDLTINGKHVVDLCTRMRNHPLGRYLVILITNNSGYDEHVRAALNSGADQYVKLPVEPSSFNGWIPDINRRINNLQELKQSHDRIKAIEKELNFMDQQLEETLTRANQLAIETQLAYLELDQIFKTTAGGILVINPEFTVLRYNEAFLNIAELEGRDVEGNKCYDVFPTPLCHTENCPLYRIQNGERRVECEVEKKDVDNQSFFYLITSTPLIGSDSDLVALVSNIFDITPRVTAERALKQSEERFRVVSEKAPFGQCILRPDLTIEYLNPKFTEVFGYTLEDLPNMRTWLEKAITDETYRKTVFDILNDRDANPLENGEEGELVFTVTCKDGQVKIVDFNEVDIGDRKRVITCVDITDQRKAQDALKKSEEKYREMSIVDDLTGLFNKRHLNTRLKLEIDRAKRYEHSFSLMLMDIDDFKQFNDTFGHTEGDRVLSRIGGIISKCIRETDSGYRYGGEEFVVIMPETKDTAAVIVAERIREQFASHVFVVGANQEIQKTLSIGLVEYLFQDDLKSIINRADQNMYQAKRSGKNRVVFNETS